MKTELSYYSMSGKHTKAFRAWRRRLGITQNEAAKRLGVSVTTVYNYGAGKRCDRLGFVNIPKTTLLACSAIEQNISPIS